MRRLPKNMLKQIIVILFLSLMLPLVPFEQSLAKECTPYLQKNSIYPYFCDERDTSGYNPSDLSCKRTTRLTLTKVGDYTILFNYSSWLDDTGTTWTEEEALIFDEFDNVIEDEIGGWHDYISAKPSFIKSMYTQDLLGTLNWWNKPSKLTLIRTPDDLPYLIFLSTLESTANVSHSYIFYSLKPSLRKIAQIDEVIDQHQALGHGTSLKVAGFYRNENNDVLFDRLTTKGHKIESHAVQKHSVETFKIAPDGILSVDLKDFDYKSYREQFNSVTFE